MLTEGDPSPTIKQPLCICGLRERGVGAATCPVHSAPEEPGPGRKEERERPAKQAKSAHAPKASTEPAYKYCKRDGARYIATQYHPYCSQRCKTAAERAVAAKQSLRSRWSEEKNRMVMVMVDAEGNEVEAPSSSDNFVPNRDGLR